MALRSGLSDIIELLYDAVTNADEWPRFAGKCVQYFDAEFGAVFHIDSAHEKLTFSVSGGLEKPPPTRRQQWRELMLAGEDPLWQFCRGHLGTAATGQIHVPIEEIHASLVYKEIMAPAGIEHRMAVLVRCRDHGDTGLVVSRGPERSPFTQRDCDILSDLAPHLNRAVRLHHQFALLDMTRRGALEVLDADPMGIALIDEKGLVLFKNKAAKDMARENDGLQFRDGGFCVSDPAITKSMRQAARELIRAAHDGIAAKGQSFQIERPSGARPLSALICSLWGNHLRFGLGFLEEPLAVLYLTDPARPLEAPWELLTRLFGLTTAEGKLLAQLVANTDLEVAAAVLGVAKNTVRAQLRSIFEKTGVHSQAELLQRVHTNDVWARTYGDADTTVSGRGAEQHSRRVKRLVRS